MCKQVYVWSYPVHYNQNRVFDALSIRVQHYKHFYMQAIKVKKRGILHF